MHADRTVDAARALAETGCLPTEIARRLGVPKSTVQYWCRGGRDPAKAPAMRHPCPRCQDVPLDEAAYAYLLGTYLGDGHITAGARTAVLAIYCADDHPGIRREVQRAVAAVMPSCRVSVTARTGCHAVKSHTTHWMCLFPQHGPGAKHTRPIVLAPWQDAVVERHPEPLLRGLFHSDGCRNINWAPRKNGPGRYEYARYLFSNKSTDIMGLCESALERVGVAYRRPRADMLSVATRAGVARLDEFIGPKH